MIGDERPIGSGLDVVSVSDPRYEADGLRMATAFSPSLQHRVDCTFWASPAARSGGDPAHLIILLHGVYASHWAWTAQGGAHIVADAVVQDDAMGAVVLAMPSDALDGHGSGYVTTQAGPVEHWIMDEVPRLAAEVVPEVDPAAQVSLVGLSMGGFGALSLGAWYGERIRAAVGMSSITRFDEMEMFVGSLDRYRIAPERRSVCDSLLHNVGRLPRLSIDCGTEDPLIESNRRLHAELEEARVDHQWVEYPGGHDWTYWHARLADALRFCLGRPPS